MFAVARDFSFSYGHRLYRYDGKCRRLHGHNARVRVEIAAAGDALNDDAMALDFAKIKGTLGLWIDEALDHRVFLAKDDPLATALLEFGESPLLFDGNPTAETLAKTIFDQAKALGLNVARVDFWETEKCRATYVE